MQRVAAAGGRFVAHAAFDRNSRRRLLSCCHLLRRFWLFFAQACTLCLAALFVVATLRPDLLPRDATAAGGSVVLFAGNVDAGRRRRGSRAYADAAKKAMPAVVNIYTSKEMRPRNPLADDPLLRRYFPDSPSGAAAARDEPRLGRHRLARRLRADQPSRDRGRRRHPARARRRPARERARARHRSRVRPRGAEGRRREPAVDHVRHARQRAGRRLRARDRQSVRLRQHGHVRASSARSAATISASTGSRISSRPTPRSIPATPAARWSTRRAI